MPIRGAFYRAVDQQPATAGEHEKEFRDRQLIGALRTGSDF
jgi:hypothetical protein